MIFLESGKCLCSIICKKNIFIIRFNVNVEAIVLDKNQNEITLKIEGASFKPYAFVLVTVLAALMQVLSSSGNNTSQAIVTLYFSIVLLTFSIYRLGVWGIIASGLSSAIFLISIHQTPFAFSVVVIANIVQATIIYFAFNFLKFSEREHFINLEMLLSIVLGFVYIIFNILFDNYYNIISSIILFLLVLLFVLGKVKTKKTQNIKYLLLVVLIPNAIGAFLGAFQDRLDLSTSIYQNNFIRWFFSNSILLLSFGYPLLLLLPSRPRKKQTKRYLATKLSTVIFFFSILLWNTIIYSLYYLGWLNKNITSYFFPWLVGNLFFIANLFFSFYPETKGKISQKFHWYEQRSIVAENNTQMLVAIISFLLPVCAQLMGTISHSISVLFIFNITSAVISIGLIWVPENNVRYMSVVKHLKTVFHLFTLSLLLLNIVLIINTSL